MGKMAVVPDGTVLSFANDTLPSFHEASTVANAAVLDSSDALTHYKRHFGVELNLFKRKSKNCDFNNGRTLHPHTEGNCQEAILGKGVDRPINGWHNCKQRGGKHFFCCITELQKKKTRELVDGEDESERAEVEGGDLLARGGKATVSVTECKCYSISSSAVKGRHGGECYK
jgi:hypothetical protein